MTKTSGNLDAELLGGGPYRRTPAPFGLLKVEGPDAEDFLQRLCSQDVAALPERGCLPAAFLDPKGKLVTTCWLARVAGAFWLEVQEQAAGALAELLDRYHFTEKLAITGMTDWQCGEWVGAKPPGELTLGSCGALDGDGFWLCAERRGVVWVHAYAPVPAFEGTWPLAGLEGKELEDDTAEVLRMAAGLARIGVDTEPGTLALEADIDDHVSLTKGCYTGQEIVARIHTYGHVNRKLRLLHIEGTGAIEPKTPLCETDEGAPVGRVMSSVQAPGRDLRVALGYLPRDFQEVGTELRLGSQDGARAVVVGGG